MGRIKVFLFQVFAVVHQRGLVMDKNRSTMSTSFWYKGFRFTKMFLLNYLSLVSLEQCSAEFCDFLWASDVLKPWIWLGCPLDSHAGVFHSCVFGSGFFFELQCPRAKPPRKITFRYFFSRIANVAVNLTCRPRTWSWPIATTATNWWRVRRSIWRSRNQWRVSASPVPCKKDNFNHIQNLIHSCW